MFRISKKINILLFTLVTILFLMSKFFAIETLATGGGTSANTNISYVEGTQTKSLPNKPESYYLNVTVSSDTYTEPYSIIYLKRSEFNQPRVTDVSGSPTIKNVSVSWDATYWKIKVTYNVLAPGPMVSNPFRATMASRKFANGETATMETGLFTKDGVELANNTKQITAETYVMGVNSQDDGTIRGWSRGGAYTNTIISDDETDANHSHIKNGFTDTWYAYAQNGTKHVNDTEISANSYGTDRRKTRTILTLPSSIIWDPSLPDNADWTYDPVNHTITQDVAMNVGALSFILKFTAKHDGTQSVNASNYSTIYIPQTNYLINDDGSVDMSTETKSRIYKSYRYAQKIYLFKWNIFPETDSNGQNNNGDRYVHLGDNDGKNKWMINVSQYWGATPVTGSTVKFKSILDTPNDRVDFTGYGFRVWESMFDAANLAKLNQNKLIGINDDGSEEVIATNINYTPVTNNVDYFKWDTDHSMTAKHYKAVRLDFNDEITISGYAENAVGLFLETKLTPQTVTNIENRLAAGQNYTAYNIGRVLSNTGDSMREAIIRRHYQRDYAKIRMDKHSQNINGNPSLTNVQLGDNINYHVYTVYDAFVSADRTVQNAKVIFLVDPELEFESALHHTYQASYRFTLNTTPQR
ncbi:MAG: cell wall-binding protein, partial [Lachnoanaerobaculum sp.]|nr:cell wall-binding protein [Lachnoanaerobaculum sp.]